MANFEKYDPRVDALVIETRTLWDPAVGEVNGEDRQWLSRALHAEPGKANKLHYERTHTGFAREITVTVEDIERLYQERVGA